MSRRILVVIPWLVLLAWATLGGAPSAHAASGRVTYSLTGTVTDVTAERVRIRAGSRLYELGRDARTREPEAPLQAGQRVTIWYRMEADLIRRVAPEQKPGKVAPEDSGPPAALPQWGDDRGFFSA